MDHHLSSETKKVVAPPLVAPGHFDQDPTSRGLTRAPCQMRRYMKPRESIVCALVLLEPRSTIGLYAVRYAPSVDFLLVIYKHFDAPAHGLRKQYLLVLPIAF